MRLEARLVKLSKTVSWILRHGAHEVKISMDKDGSVRLGDLLNLIELRGYTREDVLDVVRDNTKKRFGIRGEGADLRIWAHQGHSHGVASQIDQHALLKPVSEPPSVIVHGTFFKNLDSIRRTGLNRMTRQHIHFEERKILVDGDLTMGAAKVSVSGMRDNAEVMIHVNAAAAMMDGCTFFRSENGVVLTEGFEGLIPPKHFLQIVDKAGHPL